MRISYRHLKRYREIAYVLIKYGFSFIVEKLNIEGIAYKIPIFDTTENIKNMSTGERLTFALEELGPTYIKIGQILSTRKDLLDQDIIDELSKLRDDTGKFPTGIALEIFEEEIGQGIKQVFSHFNEEPIAAASIGQVYEATLNTGEEVIIKVQRPNIENTIKSDLEILKTIAVTLKDLKKDYKIDLVEIIEEFETQLLRELDYTFEAISATKFRKMFKDSDEVYIPEVYLEWCTKKVLVMEKVKGIKLSDIEKIKSLGWDAKNIANIGVRSFFVQILSDGFFHADPHPGNIFVIGKNKISYIDFGMIGIIDNKTLKMLNEISLAVVDKNVDKIIYLLLEMDALSSESNLSGFRQDLLYLIHYYYDVPLEKISATEILNEVFRFFRKYNVVLPNQLIILAKTVITLEGTARLLNPKFSLDSLSKEFLKHYYKHKLKLKDLIADSRQNIEEVVLDLKSIPKQLKSILRNIERNNIKLNIEDVKMTKLESVIVELTSQMSLTLVLASIIIGSSLILASPNIENNIWIKYTAMSGFFISFLIGIFLVIKSIRSKYKD
ncbi:AarF/ABC1/UbiB kinase family protein [Clostridioides mangenotii]|uniref:ABC1 kinase family protein n=1 Tax=Metaclostridioides mangenotii TaxID=1540 RepID=UPI001C0F4331|nr:AarF/ABC1/UbiB kinase family protein [Clostridioides mangenotii]MBU5306827.1 AarF/ABC1/UbiB kinase family protein [Clostridioides mangenotii]